MGMSDEVQLPVEATIPLPHPADPDREAAMRAAMFYDRAKQERDDMIRLLEQSKLALEVKEHHIQTLKLDNATERNRYDVLQTAYAEALQDKADLEAILSTQQAHHEDQAARLAKFEFSRLRRKRNGDKRNGKTVPDTSGSEGPLAELTSLVAHGKAVLGHQSEGC
jgi:hypothetical protein